jgi:hypothetical protein
VSDCVHAFAQGSILDSRRIAEYLEKASGKAYVWMYAHRKNLPLSGTCARYIGNSATQYARRPSGWPSLTHATSSSPHLTSPHLTSSPTLAQTDRFLGLFKFVVLTTACTLGSGLGFRLRLHACVFRVCMYCAVCMMQCAFFPFIWVRSPWHLYFCYLLADYQP